MPTYYLYIKTHKITGLKYFGYTTHNPHIYSGSGIDWKRHCSTYGKEHVETEIVLQTNDWDELTLTGRYYSSMWRITTSVDDFGNRIWANRIIESGGGSSELMKIFSNQPDEKKKRSDRAKKMHSNPEFKEFHRQQTLAAVQNPIVQTRKSISMKAIMAAEPAKTRRSTQIGKRSPRYDHAIYTFEHLSGIVECSTRQELIHKYNLSAGAICRVIAGYCKSHKGWKLSTKKET
jgi:hypothetical protein